MRSAAVVTDGTGRVLQFKMERVWRFPEADSAVDALKALTGISAEGTEVGVYEGVSYVVFPLGPVRIDPGLARSARWAPYDTITNSALGAALAQL